MLASTIEEGPLSKYCHVILMMDARGKRLGKEGPDDGRIELDGCKD